MAEDSVAAKRRRRRCTGGGGGDMSALPDHVLQEVLSRVGSVRDLFMFAATCRRWLGRFTDRTFLRELLCRPGGGRQQQGLLLGFFLQDATQGATMETRAEHAAQQLASACSFLPAPGSPLGPTARALTSSLVADGGGALDYAVPLAARRGIVLMQRVPRRRDTRLLLLGVCNPVTGERHLLAPLDRNPGRICGYAIVTEADVHGDDDGRFTFAQLLVAIVDLSSSNWEVHVHAYSAATRSWSAPTVCTVSAAARCFSMVGQRHAVVHQGAAHWLWRYGTPRVSVTTAHRDDDGTLYKLSVQLELQGAGGSPLRFAFTRIPLRFGGNPLLCVTGDGNLAVFCAYMSHASVSTCRQQQQAEAWERTAAFRIPAAVPYPDTHPLWQPREKWFDLTGGKMLVLYRSSAVFVVDIHRRTMEKVMDCFLPLFKDPVNRTAVPYEMDLVDFFMLKLGGLSSAGSASG